MLLRVNLDGIQTFLLEAKRLTFDVFWMFALNDKKVGKGVS
jgi:hypothetical protein